MFSAQRSRDCTVTVLVSQIEIPDSQKCTENKMNSHDSKCTETVLMFQIFLKSWFSVPPLPMLVGGIKLAIEHLSRVTNLCSLSTSFDFICRYQNQLQSFVEAAYFNFYHTLFDILQICDCLYIRRDML